jgi:hypothetical protein
MSGGIFISYRREDSAGFAGRICDRLKTRFPPERIFFDVQDIELGADFVRVLSERVAGCDAAVIIIGRNWLSASDGTNQRRLDNSADYVRIEIEAALQRDVSVIPVVVGGALMPRWEELPESLKPLAHRQGLAITHENFDVDLERLIRALSILDAARRKQREDAQSAKSTQAPAPRSEDQYRSSYEAETTKSDNKPPPARNLLHRVQKQVLHEDLEAPPSPFPRQGRGFLPWAALGLVTAAVCGAVLIYAGYGKRFVATTNSIAKSKVEQPKSADAKAEADEDCPQARTQSLASPGRIEPGPTNATASPVDEAQRAGRSSDSFPQADEDYFHEMDSGVALTSDQIKGRNMWLVWTAGDDRFWDGVTQSSLGSIDLLKLVSSHPSQTYCGGQVCDRDSRWRWLGLINEPCFRKPTVPDPKRFGLWLDVRTEGHELDPFENDNKYPGVRIGARGTTFSGGQTLPVGSYFGYATGIVGLRLFPNPDFDQRAKLRWDPERYYTDRSYYDDPALVRPYRVGVACGFCHVGPSPTHPPLDPAHPRWADLNSTIGNQYLRMDRVLVHDADPTNFLYQIVQSYPPGTMDVSLIATDHINNPRTINPIYLLGPRLMEARLWGRETLVGDQLNNKQLPGLFDAPSTVWSPRLSKDGADSVGLMAALNRAYVNIGLYSEQWTTHFDPFLGLTPASSILVRIAERDSAYWRANEISLPLMAQFLVRAGQPDKLADAPGGGNYLTSDTPLLDRGKRVFAESCARCHSSRLPEEARQMMQPGGCSGPNYLDCFKRYWAYTKTDAFKVKMRDIVAAPDFLQDNYLSTDARIPVTLLRTNACSPLASNATRGGIWESFSSETYKSLPSVGKVTLQNPFTGDHWQFPMPAGGRGYTRVSSLVSLWASAPFLLNNGLGPFSADVSVDGRLRLFASSIEQLLWPEKRDHEPRRDGTIARTSERSYVRLSSRNIPIDLSRLVRNSSDSGRLFDRDGALNIGPIPKGFPINLATNAQPSADLSFDQRAVRELATSELGDPFSKVLSLLDPDSANIATTNWSEQFPQPLLNLLKCPDFVVNRGHYFGTAEFNNTAGLTDDEKAFGPEKPLSDDDKAALIEYLVTF